MTQPFYRFILSTVNIQSLVGAGRCSTWPWDSLPLHFFNTRLYANVSVAVPIMGALAALGCPRKSCHRTTSTRACTLETGASYLLPPVQFPAPPAARFLPVACFALAPPPQPVLLLAAPRPLRCARPSLIPRTCQTRT